ncbi:MAG: nucleoside hydrolase [Ktedonobacteraceae bacterium]
MPRIILDTDPGIDDALALFLALASPEVQFEAITTVSGNVGVDFTTRNALALLELTGRTEIPVARGSSRPLLRQMVDAAFVHGGNGLGELELPKPRIQPVAQHAVDVIIERILHAPGEITLVPIGPLTNVALALRREPRIAQQVREVVIMGGALRVPGNDTPTAEFNIYADPHAAHMVLHAGWPIRLVPLDVTMQTRMQRKQVNTLTQSGSPVLKAIQQMLNYYFDVFGPAYNVSAFHMHDPLCLAAAFQPDLLTWEAVYVDVELQGSLTLGETVAYFGRPHMPLPNVQAAVGVDAEQFVQMFLQRIEEKFG